MLPVRVKSILVDHAQTVAGKVILLPSFQPIVLHHDEKYDRVDAKLLKEAQKMNQREVASDGEGQGRKKGSITYRSYTLQFKKRLVENVREENQATSKGLSRIIRAKAKQYGIHPKNITRWFHAKELKKKEGGRRALYPEMEQRLASFIIVNPKLKRKLILREAKKIMQDLKIQGRQNFSFSKGWYERFRERLARQKILPNVKTELMNRSPASSSDEFDSDSNEVKMEQGSGNWNESQELAKMEQEEPKDIYDSGQFDENNP